MGNWQKAKRGWAALAGVAILAALWLIWPTGRAGNYLPYAPDLAWQGLPAPSPAAMAGDLAAQGAVRSSLALRLVWKLRGGDRDIRLGPISWDGSEWPWDIATRLTLDRPDSFKLTLPEGMSTVAAARRLCAAFLQAPALAGECVGALLVDATAWAYADTYRFDRNAWGAPGPGQALDATVSQADRQSQLVDRAIVAPMAARQAEVWDYLAGSGREDERARTLAIAGLVAAEAALDRERPRIAGVILNRLALGMPLQIDASALYCLEEAGDPRPTRVLYKHLRVDCPFNTYLHQGLPPGPIALPGRASMAAAFAPEEHDFLYYVLFGNGPSHLFAADYKSHNLNIQAANSMRNH